jgi:xanthosine utilization system XapX-like protein
MRKLRKQFEKLLLLLAFKMDADPIFQRRIAIATLAIIAIFGMVVGYHIFLAVCWFICNEPELLCLFWAIVIPAVIGYCIYTEKP